MPQSAGNFKMLLHGITAAQHQNHAVSAPLPSGCTEIISPVLSVNCEYKSMVHFRDTVVIEARMIDYNSVKMKVVYRMTDKETGEHAITFLIPFWILSKTILSFVLPAVSASACGPEKQIIHS